MRVVHVLRKPLIGTVTNNITQYGCGALNIDRCRIAGIPWEAHEAEGLADEKFFTRGNTPVILKEPHDAGRWPANLILQHLEGCRCKDGTETWVCARGCPVAALDEQSGELATCGSGGRSMFGIGQPGVIYPDTGGASRFFKQGSKESLVTYLADLIAPDHLTDCIVLGVFGDALDLAAMDSESAHGAVVDMDGPPVQALLRVLKPGAYMLLFSPEGDPTGHAGCCTFEDYGFDVRDAILVLDSPKDRFHYVPKPSRKEREAGCFALDSVTAEVSVERDPDSAGAGNPRAGAGRGAGAPRYRCALCNKHLGGGRAITKCPEAEDEKHEPFEFARGPKIRNLHPTVKPITVMERLLENVPTDAPVIDPFMGSGTTMLACLRTGHDGIGIERDPNYIPIADARVRHWDRAVAAWSSVEIESDVEGNQQEAVEVSLTDFLGL